MGGEPVVKTRAAFCPAPCGEDEERDGRQEGERDADESEYEGETARKCPKVALHGAVGWWLGCILRAISVILEIYFYFSNGCGFLMGNGEKGPAAGDFLGFIERICAPLLIRLDLVAKQPIDDAAEDVVPNEAEDGAEKAPDAFEDGKDGGDEEGEDLADGFHGVSLRVDGWQGYASSRLCHSHPGAEGQGAEARRDVAEAGAVQALFYRGVAVGLHDVFQRFTFLRDGQLRVAL